MYWTLDIWDMLHETESFQLLLSLVCIKFANIECSGGGGERREDPLHHKIGQIIINF